MPDARKAVIDLGSNSIRLVIYDQGPHGTQREVDDLKQVVRLSNHLGAGNAISEKGIRLTLRTLQGFKELCDAYHVTEIIGVATQAVRMASNQSDLLHRILQETGFRFRVISGEEEARYGYLAVVNTLPFDEAITVDVGGGSTELTYFRDRRLLHAASIPYGAVSLTRAFIKNEPAASQSIKALERAVRQGLEKFPWLKGRRCPVVGIGGTARAVARMHQRRQHYPLQLLHGYAIWPMEVSVLLDVVRSLPIEKRSDVTGLANDRADIIVAGMSIIDQVLTRAGGTQFVISNQGLRDGVLIEEILKVRDEGRLPDMLGYSLENLVDQFQINRTHAFHVWRLADQLLSAMLRYQWMRGRELRTWLRVAALLHDIGRSISTYNTSNHNFYLLMQVPLYGISHRDRVIAAAIAAFKNSKQVTELVAAYAELLDDDDVVAIAGLGVVLGLARVLDRTETGVVKAVELIPAGNDGILRIHSDHPLGIELNLASDWQKKWRKVFQRAIQLEVLRVDPA